MKNIFYLDTSLVLHLMLHTLCYGSQRDILYPWKNILEMSGTLYNFVHIFWAAVTYLDSRRWVVELQQSQGAGLKPQCVVRFLLPDLTLKGWGELCAFWSEQTPGSKKNRAHCVSFYKVRGFSHRKKFAWEFGTLSLRTSPLSTWVFTAGTAFTNSVWDNLSWCSCLPGCGRFWYHSQTKDNSYQENTVTFNLLFVSKHNRNPMGKSCNFKVYY